MLFRMSKSLARSDSPPRVGIRIPAWHSYMRGIYPGIHCSGAVGAAKAINMGFKLVTLSNESGLMATYAKMQVAQTRKESNGNA